MPPAFLESEVFAAARREAAGRLIAARGRAGHWEGRLSSSALSTATALTALRLVDERLEATTHAARISAGVRWLVATQLPDGSWGDTVASRGNLSTTVLCWATLAAVVDAARREKEGTRPPPADGNPDALAASIEKSAAWIAGRTGGLGALAIARALRDVYGRDRTFAVPILTHVALCGRFGDPRTPQAWREVPQLPFQFAALPQSWFRLVDLQVVSYALPALIAIGQVRHAVAPTGVGRPLRECVREVTLARLADIQPVDGGFLEATPLTSFVTMSLAGMGRASHVVARRGAAFLAAGQRDDGSWPIDTNLATWGTTLSINALAAGGGLHRWLADSDRARIRAWLLDQQWRTRHPATGAQPGGWAWTDLPGGVPDADDTSGAVAALALLDAAPATDVTAAAVAGLGWLVDLANRDGGIPTFCRGWGRLPFDMSCPDITAHFLRAVDAWDRAAVGVDGRWEALTPRLTRARRAAGRYLRTTQAPDGSWNPLWFGNEWHATQSNPTYGTAKVVAATLDRRGTEWLLTAMRADGGFGGGARLPASIEETAVATDALAAVAIGTADASLRGRATAAAEAGARWLVEHTAGGIRFEAAPIGLYFAKLWYFEDLYPLVFTVGAFERAGAITA